MSSSNRSTSIPLSFDRFRVKSIQFLSPFRHHPQQHQIRIQQNTERSRTRKVQVHPKNSKSTSTNSLDRNPTHLFRATDATHQFSTKCPPTPCMIAYRCNSLTNKSIPTRIIQRPQSFDQCLNQINKN